MPSYNTCSLFAGAGGIDLGFELSGGFNTIIANEMDNKASETYQLNFNAPVIESDIREIEPESLPEFDVLMAGFPCTSFSIAGYQKGFEDEMAGDLFFETLRIIQGKKPRVVFLENVKNLAAHDKGNTFKVIREALEGNGYKLHYQVMNATEYGNTPQNRERIYIVGFREEADHEAFQFPDALPLERGIQSVIGFSEQVDERYYYRRENTGFYDMLEEAITSQSRIYQWRRKYVRENKSGVSPTLTANMGTGGHNVPLILSDSGIRKLTPRECFRLQGFPENFTLPEQANCHLYKQAGNSVVVPVVRRIAEQIHKALEK